MKWRTCGYYNLLNMNILKLNSTRAKAIGIWRKQWNSMSLTRYFCTQNFPSSFISNSETAVQKAQRNILKKTKAGYKAMENIEALEYDKHGFLYNRKESYDVFIERMFSIYKSERIYLKNLEKENNYNLTLKEINQFDKLADAKKAR